MSSIMDDSFDEALANMEMPEDPGPLANIKAPNDKPDDEKHTETLPSSSSSSSTTTMNSGDNNATTNTAAIVATTTSTSYSKNAIQVNPNQKGNPLLKVHELIFLLFFKINNYFLRQLRAFHGSLIMKLSQIMSLAHTVINDSFFRSITQ